jgi:CDP-diacylglycerol--glycerol-3-phosphate 3-phosphatidyltransferase
VNWGSYLDRWSALHGGYDPRRSSVLVRGWLRLAYQTARLLAGRRVGPNAATAAGVLLSAAVPVLAKTSPVAAAGLVALSALADTVDGALALVSGRASRLGELYDHVADRLGEVCWLVAFWLVGAPAWLVLVCGGLTFLHEYVRARAAVAGMPGIGVVTVAERPTRVVVAAFGLAATAVVPAATVAVAVWTAFGGVGLVQLFVVVNRRLPGVAPDEVGDELRGQ